MLAAIAASGNPDCRITLFEKNPILGKKLLVTGKGRCNLTNDCEPREFAENVVRGKKFLTSSIYGFSPAATMGFFTSLGVELKTERGRRVFPVSDRAEDVRSALARKVRSLENVRVVSKKVENVKKSENGFSVVFSGESGCFDKVIVATGGLSYPKTGSTGDGYRFAGALGHTVISPNASLVGLVCREKDCAELEGLSLRNVALTLSADGKRLYREQGEMLFTDRGVSGPLVLSASANLPANRKAKIAIDLKPALTEDELDKRLLSDFSKFINRDLVNSFDELLPKRLIPVIVARSGIPPRLKVNVLTKEQRKKLLGLFKCFELTIEDTEPIEQAVVTRGGVDLKEIDPKTMESKLTKGLYFAGELLDADAYTGGFNLQIAFSTGFAAGKAAAGL